MQWKSLRAVRPLRLREEASPASEFVEQNLQGMERESIELALMSQNEVKEISHSPSIHLREK